MRFFIFGVGMGVSLFFRDADNASQLTTPGPLIGRWNAFLERRFPLRVGRPSRLTGNSRVSIAGLTKRVSSDQLLM